jgi:hypothetical protein
MELKILRTFLALSTFSSAWLFNSCMENIISQNA